MVPSLNNLLANRGVNIPGCDMEGKVVCPGALWVCCQGTRLRSIPPISGGVRRGLEEVALKPWEDASSKKIYLSKTLAYFFFTFKTSL